MSEQEYKRPDRDPDLEVELSLFGPDAGGRDRPLWQGCRVPHDFGHSDGYNTGMYEFSHTAPSPGETCTALVWLMAPEVNAGRLCPNFEYKIWDGRFIGQGTILKILNPILASVE